ncbi:MAG: NTP transferase domain-containing protein [Dehalococcoidales bacterium]|nr:NTP transferase domain-containing protein [Dehalococcoidales bacterium]
MSADFNAILSRALSDLYTPFHYKPITEEELAGFIGNSVCILPCGGESKRMSGLADKHKAALELPDGETLISRTIRSYLTGGVKNFVLLVGINADSVIESTKHLQQYGAEIKYCPDPGKPVGRGGAILNAIQQGFISRSNNSIVHNADDQIVGYPGNFLADIYRAHINHQKSGGWATAVIARSTPYAYTGMQVTNGQVTNIVPTPDIPVPTHVGITIMSPDIYTYFDRLFNLTEKKDFEGYLFPILAKENRLFAFAIPGDCWYPVNNPKEYNNLVKKLRDLPPERISFDR